MRLSKYFLKTKKETSSDASLISHKLMIKSSMIKQTTSGIYTWLPLGLKVLKKIEDIVRKIHNKYGCQELLMPTIQSSSIWKQSGRYDDYGPEMLKFHDRNKKELLYGPTNEELITEIFKEYINSYKDLPINLYQIQWKFRDEIRPRHGVMRCREFLMKDSYSFDCNQDDAIISYQNMFKCYMEIFNELDLFVVPVRADPGVIGGMQSHEFHLICSSGDTDLIYDKKLNQINHKTFGDSLKVNQLLSFTKEEADKQFKKRIPIDFIEAKGIEIAHIFYFGKKYSEKLGAYVLIESGKKFFPEMGSYGIGISRLVAAIIEYSHDDNGIIWPKSISPFDVGLVNLNNKNNNLTKISDKIYNYLKKNNVDVLYDDTNKRPGEKFANMDLIGLPFQIIIGEKSIKNNFLELKNRQSKEITIIKINNLNKIIQEIK